jgi:DHA3 family macrolide efflux protein-like MFS transporter
VLRRAPAGMRAFTIIWAGQLLSLTGSAMTTFALTVWLWQETGQATTVALHAFFTFAPGLLVSPLAGVLVDRWNRKWVMLSSDIATGFGTLGILTLVSSGRLEVWHLYALAAWSGTVGAFQLPALAAAITTLVSKAKLTRANALRSLASSSAQVAAPALAGILLAVVGIAPILLIDLASLTLAVLALLIVDVPNHQAAEQAESFWDEAATGFRCLIERRGLLGLSIAFSTLQFFGMMSVTIIAPMILARTNGNEAIYGMVGTAMGAGGVAGGLLLSFVGAPKRYTFTIAFGIAAGSSGFLVLGLTREPIAWAASMAFAFFFFPIVGSASAALKQRKVPTGIQGRVFAADQLLQITGIALGILSAGPLADYVFEPAMTRGAAWVAPLSPLVGTGPGAGMSLMIALAGAFGIATGISAYLSRPVRQIENALPDHH